MTFGERLVEARKEKGLSQKALAEALEITPTRLNYWEKDKREPTVDMINRLCETLEVDGDYLIGRLDKEKIPARAEPTPALKDIPEKLIQNYHRLNEIGQKRLIEYAEDLATSAMYQAYEYQVVETKTSDGRTSYGIRISNSVANSVAQNISSDRHEVEELVKILKQNDLSPMSLMEVIDDYLTSRHNV